MNHYTVYKIVNLVNGKYYIGKHQTKDLGDEYMGSGKLIKAAIKKHGVKNFRKEILFVFETEQEMNDKEAELVTEELIASGSVYNLCPGGQGGWGYINLNNLGVNDNQKLAAATFAKKIAHLGGAAGLGKKRPDAKKARAFTGRTHTSETKDKMSQAISSKCLGKNNSQFGTMWITNGTENRKIKKDLDSIPEGWYKGRNQDVRP